MRAILCKAPLQPAAVRQHYTTDHACWVSFTSDLIYAAAYGPAGYVEQIKRRREMSSRHEEDAYNRGRRLCEALAADYPCDDVKEDRRRLVRAQRADADPSARIRYVSAGFLPKGPLTERELESAERQRRAGISDSDRQANAESVAARIA